MERLCIKVDEEEVDGDTPPIKTSKAVLDLLKSQDKTVSSIDLQFPKASGTKGDREGIMGWYRPREYLINGTSISLSKIVYLQELLNYEANYLVNASNGVGTNTINLDIKKIN